MKKNSRSRNNEYDREIYRLRHQVENLFTRLMKRGYQVPTRCGEALRFVAKMGGFNGRKSDGEPGTVSIWRGLIKLEAKVEMFRHLKEKYQF